MLGAQNSEGANKYGTKAGLALSRDNAEWRTKAHDRASLHCLLLLVVKQQIGQDSAACQSAQGPAVCLVHKQMWEPDTSEVQVAMHTHQGFAGTD